MNKLIDIGEDKNLISFDPEEEAKKPQPQFMMDDLAKNADETIAEARKATWDLWINSEPLLISHYENTSGKTYLFFISDLIKEKVVLVDFWDYTLLQSRRSINYIREWHKRYASAGLVVVGVHTPFFSFGKDKKFILDAAKELELTYPIVMDNNFNIWKSFENRYWPRRILLDSKGKVAKDVIGEGQYAEMEQHLQLALREINPGLSCPPVKSYILKTDDPLYSYPTTTPEILLGVNRKQPIGNSVVPSTAMQEISFKDMPKGQLAPGLPYFSGDWVAHTESFFGNPNLKSEHRVTLNFSATDVYIVARARMKNALDFVQGIKLQVQVDKKNVSEGCYGRDLVMNEYRKTVCTLKDPKLYHIVTKLDHVPHELTLISDAQGVETFEIFAFFFEHNT